MKTKKLYEIIHGKGEGACGGIAFYWDRPPMRYEQIVAEHAVYMNRENPVDGERMVCESCGNYITLFGLYPKDGFEGED